MSRMIIMAGKKPQFSEIFGFFYQHTLGFHQVTLKPEYIGVIAVIREHSLYQSRHYR